MSLRRVKCVGVSLSAMVLAIAGSALAANPTISFQDILRDPGNVQLNLDYARQEAKSGNLLQAAAAMERLLIHEPGWDEARLFYAILLYRLDDPQAAEHELAKLEGRPLPGQMMHEVESYRAKSTSRTQPFSWDAHIALGYRTDSDASRLFDDAFQFGDRTEDEAVTTRAGLTLRRKLSDTTDTNAFAKVIYYNRDYDEFSDRSFSNAVVQIGLDGQLMGMDLTGMIEHRQVDIDGNNYLKETGLRVVNKLPLGERFALVGQNYYFSQDFSNDPPFSGQGVRSGDLYGFDTGVYYDLNPRNRIGAKLLWSKKSADYDPFAYDSLGFNIAYDLRIGRGAYFDLDYFDTTVSYDGADSNVITVVDDREDDRRYLRGAIGVPLSTFLQGRGSANAFMNPEKIKFELLATREERDSNYDTYDFDNTGIEFRLVYGFGH